VQDLRVDDLQDLADRLLGPVGRGSVHAVRQQGFGVVVDSGALTSTLPAQRLR
jgi:hypothetical protein